MKTVCDDNGCFAYLEADDGTLWEADDVDILYEQKKALSEACSRLERERDSYRDALYTARRELDVVQDTSKSMLEKLRIVGDQFEAANSRVTELTKQLDLRLRAESCDKEELLAECIKNRQRLAAAEAALISKWTENHISTIDRVIQSHINAVQQERDEARARLAEAEAENKRLRLHNMDLREVASEHGLVYRDDNDQLRFSDSGDLVGKEG